jgi:hypothetical protein
MSSVDAGYWYGDNVSVDDNNSNDIHVPMYCEHECTICNSLFQTNEQDKYTCELLISVFEWTSASDKTWKVDGMNWFLGKVEFSSSCLGTWISFELLSSTETLLFVLSHCIFKSYSASVYTSVLLIVFFYIKKMNIP